MTNNMKDDKIMSSMTGNHNEWVRSGDKITEKTDI
jgi:hypothetical protein